MPTFPVWDSSARRVLEAACAEAVASARWDEAELSTRWPGEEARALMLAKAAECALSAAARDQLLSVAIERVVGAGDRGGPLLDWNADPDDRAEIARQAFAFGPNKASETDALVESMEGRHARRLHGRSAPARLAARLREDALLHEALWDHPGIPAGHHIRLAMLCAIPRLIDRADELMSSGPNWLRALVRRAPPLLRRRPA